MFKFNSIEEALEDIKAGKIIIVIDDEDRENEGDLLMAAEYANAESINFMASADFLRFVVTMLRFEFVYSFTAARPPQVSVTAFTSYICCTYTLKFGQYRTLFCLGNSSVSSMPYMQFLFVRQRLCFGLPSDSASRWTPLPSAKPGAP